MIRVTNRTPTLNHYRATVTCDACGIRIKAKWAKGELGNPFRNQLLELVGMVSVEGRGAELNECCAECVAAGRKPTGGIENMAAKKTEPKDQTSNGKNGQEVKIEKFRRGLLVELTDKQKAELADRAARLYGEIEQTTEEIKASAKQAKGQLDEKRAEHKRVNMEYREGKKLTDVTCERHFIYRTRTVKEIRTDTGALLSERPMTEGELQTSLKFEEKQKAKLQQKLEDAGVPPAGETEPKLATEKKKRTRKPRAAAAEEAQADG